MEKQIKSFKGKYEFLSNFYPCRVIYEGLKYPSVEHAFQAAKTLDMDKRKDFQIMRTPADAKYFGKHVTLRDDWETVKYSIMEELLKSKFSNEELKHLLLDTCSVELIEGNNHHDTCWGVCNGVGDNNLGKLLMKVRDYYANT